MADEVVHWAAQVMSPCGVRTKPFLPRTGVFREVTCEACRAAVCQRCEGTGLINEEPFRPGPGINLNHCPVCRGNGLKNW